MLPKVTATPPPTTHLLKRENIASCLIIEDHLKLMLAKKENQVYKPWKTKYAPKYPHSSFGDFPKELLQNHKKIEIKQKKFPDFETTIASTILSKIFFFFIKKINFFTYNNRSL